MTKVEEAQVQLDDDKIDMIVNEFTPTGTPPLTLTFTNTETGQVFPYNLIEIKDFELVKHFLVNNVIFKCTLSGSTINPKFVRRVLFKGHPFKYLKWRLTNIWRGANVNQDN